MVTLTVGVVVPVVGGFCCEWWLLRLVVCCYFLLLCFILQMATDFPQPRTNQRTLTGVDVVNKANVVGVGPNLIASGGPRSKKHGKETEQSLAEKNKKTLLAIIIDKHY